MADDEIEMINVGANEPPADDIEGSIAEGGEATDDRLIATADVRDPPREEPTDSLVTRWKVIALITSITTVIFVALFGSRAGRDAETLTVNDSSSSSQTLNIEPFDPNPTLSGQWETVFPNSNGAAIGFDLGMQSVHAILLPSGKILIAPGSSWRNIQKGTPIFPLQETYEEGKDWPGVNEGLFNRDENPFENSKKESYYNQVNNVGVYDPVSNEFFRVPHPVPVTDPDFPDNFIPSDLFCSGQIQLPNGNPLFMGGTQFYFPYRTGHNAAYIYDWIRATNFTWEEYDWTVMPNQDNPSETPWTFAGLMEYGRWYPSAVPLMDGRLVIVGGFVGFKNITPDSTPDMYQFQMNTGVEFFDYRLFDSDNPNEAWSYQDVKNTTNSPFSTALGDLTPAALNCTRKQEACDPTPTAPNCTNKLEECTSYKFDSFKLYPRAYLMPDGRRIFFTRDGDFNSLRTATGEYMRNTNKTYIMDVKTSPGEAITFEYGPDLPRYALNSGTVIRNPKNFNQLLISGGMPNYGGTLGPSLLDASDDRCDVESENFDVTLANRFLGSRGSRGLITYNMPSNSNDIGSWDRNGDRGGFVNTTFLGETKDGDRTMFYMIVLPTEDLLVVGGGNYDFANGVKYPILYTPNADNPSTYGGRIVSSTYYDRLYHCTALLLADGRIFMAGGNPNRASITEEPLSRDRTDSEGRGQKKFNPLHVDREVYFFGDGRMGKGPKPSPAEQWTAEIYSPPYLFIDGNRRTEIQSMAPASTSPSNFEFSTPINGKMHYLFKSRITVRMELASLPTNCAVNEGKSSLVLMKLAAPTHGWDSGQQLFKLEFDASSDTSIVFTTPDSSERQIIPAFYHLFYIDCNGKPTVAESVRFDDNVNSINATASAA